MKSCTQLINKYEPKGYVKPKYPTFPFINLNTFIDYENVNAIRSLNSLSLGDGAHNLIEYYYTFDLPDDNVIFETKLSSEKLLSHYLNFPEVIIHMMALDDTTKNTIRTAMNAWERAVNIKFIEAPNAPKPMHIYQYQLTPDHAHLIDALNCHPNNVKLFPKGQYIENGVMLLNGDYITSCQEIESPRGYKTILHEIGHALGLEHLFIAQPTDSFTNTTSFSVMNYQFEYDQTSGQPIYALTPLESDITAAQHLYGVNRITASENTRYDLTRFTPYETKLFKTTTSFWDTGGIDTFDASKIGSDSILINLREHGRSDLGKGYLNTGYNKIENVISSQRINTVILNSLNNTIDVTRSLHTTIIIDPQECGHDQIIGFSANTTKIVLERAPLNHPKSWKLFTKNSCNAQSGQCKTQTEIFFDEKNTIHLIANNQEPLQSKSIFSNERYDVLRCQLFPEEHDASIMQRMLSAFPQTFCKDFISAIQTGVVINFFLSLTIEQLKQYEFTEQQINLYAKIMRGIFTFSQYSVPASFAALLTSHVLEYFSFGNATCSITSTIVAETVETVLDPTKITYLPGKIAGKLSGNLASQGLCSFGLWAKNYLLSSDCNPDNLLTNTTKMLPTFESPV